MNRNLLVSIIVIILIVGAGGYFLMTRENATVDQVAQVSPQPSVAASASTEKTSLKNFMTMTGTQECQFTDPENGTSGVVYLDSGKMRGDLSTITDGKPTPTHIINDGQDIYIWADDQQMGFKTSIAAIEAMSGQTGSVETININKEVEYKCSNWTADPLKFAVPVEIKFQDMEAMMKNMQNMMHSSSPNSSVMPEENAEACKACDNLPDNARAQCRTGLKCN